MFDHERELMSPHKEKLALFIDGANLYATARSLGFDIDYKRLLRDMRPPVRQRAGQGNGSGGH